MSYACITGASSGIGKALAWKFAEAGHDLVITARRLDVLNAMKAEIESKHGVTVKAIASDLSDEASVYEFYQQLAGLDVRTLINNAGFGNFNNLWEVETDWMVKMIDLNVRALTILSTLYTKDYKDKEAQLINVASVGGYVTMPTAAIYVATKFYVSAFTESLAQELEIAGSPMKAKILAPGPVETEFVDVASHTAKNEIDLSSFPEFHSAEHMADCAWTLYQSDDVVGIVDMADMSFSTRGKIHPVLGG